MHLYLEDIIIKSCYRLIMVIDFITLLVYYIALCLMLIERKINIY